MQSAERYVVVDEVQDGQAPEVMQAASDVSMPKPVDFVTVDKRYFTAEYTPDGPDIVIHYFVSDAVQNTWPVDAIEQWWLDAFATTMSTLSQEYFQATLPRIMAKYTHEVASWWFKAQGYDFLLDRAAYLNAFFELLDETLHSALLPADASLAGRV
jgi:hypothetical protein